MVKVEWKVVRPLEGYQFAVKDLQPFCAECGRPVAHGKGEEYECRYCDYERAKSA